MKIVNPATEEVIAELEEDTRESIVEKLEQLRSAQPGWSDVPLATRIEVIKKFGALLKEHIEELSNILTSEVGKPLQQSRNEVNGAISRIQWLTDFATPYLSDEIMSQSPGMVEKITYEPLGVVCNISAWNYPFLVGVNVFVPALLAGNAVLYKPSEYATLTGLEIEKLFIQAGVSEDAFKTAIGAKAVGEVLLDMPLDGYFFTGSYKTGKHIYERVSSKMVPCQCEMGGKDPLYIADDVADIKNAAAGTADGAFYNNGQSCCSVERIYVHEKVFDQYVEEFVKEVKGYKVGAPSESGVYIGPLARKEQVDFIDQQVSEAVKYGATLHTGGKRPEGKGYYYEPTVLTEVTHQMSVMQDESFGPVIGIMKVKDDEEAVSLMGDTSYGLTAAVYCAEQKRAVDILKRINTGTGYWNCCDRVSAALPWSGRNHSGFGVTLSHAGLRAFTKPKAYHIKNPS
jgi:acyl-CoA reductase-like NAD-dependent aldehyde dehydrogenase